MSRHTLLLFAAILALHSCTTLTSASVLLLGSGGLIGQALVKALQPRNVHIHHVHNRSHIDLRQPHSLDIFTPYTHADAADPLTAIYFLACEVGGSKYIDSQHSGIQQQIISSNIEIYQNVIAWYSMHAMHIPLVFTSSYLQAQPSAYGSVKRLGEQWLRAVAGNDDQQSKIRVARLWNIYGEERFGHRSHVLTDWITNCIKHQSVQSLTDGSEPRQFIHASDTAEALITIAEQHEVIPFVSDVGSGVWYSMRDVAQMVQQVYADNTDKQQCQFTYSKEQAKARTRVSPMMKTPLHDRWRPTVSLFEGVSQLHQHYHGVVAAAAAPTSDSVTEDEPERSISLAVL